MLKKQLFQFVLIVFIWSLASVASAACVGSYCNDPTDSPSSRLIPRQGNQNGWVYGYYEYLPKQYATEPTRTFPLIIHAHGVGEGGNGTGSQLAKVLTNGVPKFIRLGHNMTFTVNGKQEAFIVLMPQAAGGWVNKNLIDYMIERAKKTYRIDTKRIYLMGLSAGGAGVWDYAGESASYAAKIAAIAPSCAAMNNYNGQSQSKVNTIAAANLPVWAFHGTGDNTISYDWSVSMVNSINAITPKPNPLAKLRLYPGVGHNVRDKSMDPTNTNDTPNVYQRLLQYTNDRSNNVVIPTNQAPVANAGVDQTISLPINSVTLNGGGSKDSDGTIKTYTWRQVSGPSTATIGSTSSVSTLVSNLVSGKYEFELLITDDKGANAGDRVIITVNTATTPTNQAPVANAGVDQTISLPINSVTLNGGGSKDSDGTIKTYTWRQVSGPSTATIGSTSSVSTLVSNLIAGTYVYELKVADDKGATAVDSVIVIVKSVASPTTATGTLPIGCTRILQPNDNNGKGFYYDANNLGIKPGETICIKPGSYSHFRIANLSGTISQPIIIKNIDGLVELGTGFYYALNFPNGKHFRVLGNGVANIKYGIKIALKEGATSVAVGMGNSSDFELAHMDISNAGVAIMAKVNTSCDPMSWKENYVMKNIKIHDMYIHDIRGEGFYIGNTSLTETVTCNGQTVTKEPAGYDGMDIYNITMERTDWDGIQLARTKNARIYNNSITDWGRAKIDYQAAGILLGGFSNGYVYNNILTQGHSAGLQFYGVGKAYFYNNIINKGGQGTGQDAIYIADRPLSGAGYPLSQAHIFNNTIISPNRMGIYIGNQRGSYDIGSVIQNNVIIGHGGGGSGFSISVPSPIVRNNMTFNSINTAGLSTAFIPLSTSQLVDGGYSISAYGVLKDYYGLQRVQGNAVDIGAAESVFTRTNSTSINQAPVANAGVDQTISLPTNSVTLNGGGSKDSDGTIKTYTWRQVSGPNTSTISSTSSVSTLISNLIAGTYVYELKVADDKGATAVDSITVIVKTSTTTSTSTTTTVNKAPTMIMYGTQTISLPFNSAAIYGVSRDSDGSIKSHQWKQISGPSFAIIETPTNFYTRVASLVEGIYVFELTATDNGGLTVSGRVTVTVQKSSTTTVVNQAPVSNAGVDQSIVLPSNSVTLDGSQSKDIDGTIKSYTWRQVSGPSNPVIISPSTVSTSITNLVAGVYVFELKVMDDKGLTAVDTLTINVNNVASNVVKRRILVDLGSDSTLARSITPSPDKNGNYWNSMTSFRANDILQGLVDTTNAATSLSIKVINDLFAKHPSSPVGTNVVGDAVSVGDYPASAVRDNAFAWSVTNTGQWMIGGLSPQKKYTIKFWGNRNATDNRTIQIKLSTDSVWQEYNASKNIDYNVGATIIVSGVSQAFFDIRVKAGSTFGNISVIDIVEE